MTFDLLNFCIRCETCFLNIDLSYWTSITQIREVNSVNKGIGVEVMERFGL